ncbi:hypothetical protein BDF19DRAFT_444536 [Syncephalis fuscata]|nr:hypothetical protein BDF19DRAFT_444536 [Syncephalis fuscata]
MTRLFLATATLMLATFSLTDAVTPQEPGSPKLSPVHAASSALNVIPAAGQMTEKPSGAIFKGWADKDVSQAHARLEQYMKTTATIPVPSEHDAIDDLLDDKKVPNSVYAVASDARELFKRDAIPSVSQLGNELPAQLDFKIKQTSKLVGGTSVAVVGTIRIAGMDLPPEAVDIIRRLVEHLVNGSLQDLLMKALGAQLALRIVRMLAPIAYAALSMLVSDLRHAADLVMESVLAGIERSVWLKKLRDLVVKDLRENTLAMLVEIKNSLSAHLGDVLISAIALACQIGEAGYSIIRGLFGSIIDKYVAQIVGTQVDRLSAHLRKLWNMPELLPVVNALINSANKSNPVPSIGGPVTIKRRYPAIAA